MSRGLLMGIAIGIGLGWLNATALGVPGWANILIMGGFAIGAELTTQSYGSGHSE